MERYRFSAEELEYLEGLPAPVAVYQSVGERVFTLALSAGYLELFEFPDRETAYSELRENALGNVHRDDVARVGDAVRRFIRESGRYETIFRARKYRERDCHIIHAVGRHMYTPTGARLAYVWFMDEGAYTEDGGALNPALNSALHEESIMRAGLYDSLTGLPSMTRFFTLARAAKREMDAKGENAVMLYMDLNGMKNYNDMYGFAEGDKLLIAFARLLERVFGKESCCHISADRFAAFAPEEGLEERLSQLFAGAKNVNGGNSLPVRAGVYSTGIESVPASSACDRAKIACDAIPKSDVSLFNYYNLQMQREVKRRQYILSNIDRAIAEKWIQVYFQPIIRAVNGRVSDEEALARWIDPAEGFLSPADFIPTLEAAGLIYKLDLYVLEQVLEKMKAQQRAGLYLVPHSVNLSRSDFDACDIVEEIRRRVDASGIGRNWITIEITESMVGRDFDFMKAQVERFRSLGFPVWMDDFGSGYSSLDVLQSIRFDLIKFDMSFLRKLDEGDSGKIILTELVKMATSMGLDTVCEGVETLEQARFLREIGCSKLQGFYYCRPVSFDQILERYRQGVQIGFENPAEVGYFNAVGRVNLYDISVFAREDERAFKNSFATLPMGIIEIRDDTTRFLRSNQSYRDFVRRFFKMDLSAEGMGFQKYNASFMHNVVKTCCEQGVRAFYNEKMPDGSVVHSFARRVDVNPVSGVTAVAIAVLSITEPGQADSYAEIARALAADYYNIYVVDLDTEAFIEYTSPVGEEEMAIERRGERFFTALHGDAAMRVCEADRRAFLDAISKQRILRELDTHGVYTLNCRLMDRGRPVRVDMKITRLHAGGNRIIIGISAAEPQNRR